MYLKNLFTYQKGSVLPTVIVVSLVIFISLSGLLMLWGQEMLLFTRTQRLQQARADVESAATIRRLYPTNRLLLAADGYQLYDSVPQSRVFVRCEPWGLYELQHIASSDTLVRTCHIVGGEFDPDRTLFYADNRTPVTLAGTTRLQGNLYLPERGVMYGRVGADFYHGEPIPRTVVRGADSSLPDPDPAAVSRIDSLIDVLSHTSIAREAITDSCAVSFIHDSTRLLLLATPYLADCVLQGRIVVQCDSLYIDSTSLLCHPLVVAHKIIVGPGAHLSAQLFARDTVVVGPRAVLEYPSGIYAGSYVELDEHAEVNGYVVVRDTVQREKMSPAYRQGLTARLRGGLYVEGAAQLQGIISGKVFVEQAAYFSAEGYYRDMIYDFTLLQNPVTAQPLWLAGCDTLHRKEAVCVD